MSIKKKRATAASRDNRTTAVHRSAARSKEPTEVYSIPANRVQRLKRSDVDAEKTKKAAVSTRADDTHIRGRFIVSEARFGKLINLLRDVDGFVYGDFADLRLHMMNDDE
jgi:hypothetical protein